MLVTTVKKPKKKSTSADPVSNSPAKVYGACNGEKKSCPVHCVYLPRSKWSFYPRAEDVDALIDGLTPRGIREKELRQVLIDEKDGLKKLIQKCPIRNLNLSKEYPEDVGPAKRPARVGASGKNHMDPNLNYPVGTPIDVIMELQLRDMILEMEEKAFLGGLGSLKVIRRLECLFYCLFRLRLWSREKIHSLQSRALKNS